MSGITMKQRRGIWLFIVFLVKSLIATNICADEYRTPRAGEEFHTQLFGEPVSVPGRDRRSVTAVSFGALWTPYGTSGYEFIPVGSFYVWRNLEDGRKRFRGEITGVYNDIRFNLAPEGWNGVEGVFTFNNFIIPFDRTESVEGMRQSALDLRWYWFRAGIGLGYRTAISPGNQDNAFEFSLTYEPGFLWFDRARHTSPNFILPQDTYEGQVHIRTRADGLERNLLELPHQGYATGFDLIYGHRANWETWSDPVFGQFQGKDYSDWFAASGHLVVAGGLPFVDSERHRLIGSFYGGFGSRLDRFSAFRLPGRPTGWEQDVIAKPVLPGANFLEFFPRSYAVFDMVYRYEALFFAYPYLRGTWAFIDRPRFRANGTAGNRMDALSSLGGGFVSGAPWNSQVEFEYTYSFGILRDKGGRPGYGGHGLFVLWSKEF